MSNNHIIRLRSAWKTSQKKDESDSIPYFSVTRWFRRPSGLTEDQSVHFCFRPVLSDVVFFLNDEIVDLVTLDGLGIANISNGMRDFNQLEIRCRTIQNNGQEFNEQFIDPFEAWLEIKSLHPFS